MSQYASLRPGFYRLMPEHAHNTQVIAWDGEMKAGLPIKLRELGDWPSCFFEIVPAGMFGPWPPENGREYHILDVHAGVMVCCAGNRDNTDVSTDLRDTTHRGCRWKFEKAGDSRYYIQSCGVENFYLAVAGQGKDDGTPVVVWDKEDNPHFRWYIKAPDMTDVIEENETSEQNAASKSVRFDAAGYPIADTDGATDGAGYPTVRQNQTQCSTCGSQKCPECGNVTSASRNDPAPGTSTAIQDQTKDTTSTQDPASSSVPSQNLASSTGAAQDPTSSIKGGQDAASSGLSSQQPISSAVATQDQPSGTVAAQSPADTTATSQAPASSVATVKDTTSSSAATQPPTASSATTQPPTSSTASTQPSTSSTTSTQPPKSSTPATQSTTNTGTGTGTSAKVPTGSAAANQPSSTDGKPGQSGSGTGIIGFVKAQVAKATDGRDDHDHDRDSGRRDYDDHDRGYGQPNLPGRGGFDRGGRR